MHDFSRISAQWLCLTYYLALCVAAKRYYVAWRRKATLSSDERPQGDLDRGRKGNEGGVLQGDRLRNELQHHQEVSYARRLSVKVGMREGVDMSPLSVERGITYRPV